MIFCHNFKICCDLPTFGKSVVKKSAFWVKNSVSWTRSALIHGAYMQIHICTQKRSICQKVSEQQKFCGHFCARQKAANFCHPVPHPRYPSFRNSWCGELVRGGKGEGLLLSALSGAFNIQHHKFARAVSKRNFVVAFLFYIII